MGWRVIVRVSINKDSSSTIRNTVIKPLLEDAGLRKRGRSTATWESNDVPEKDAAKQLARLLPRLARAGQQEGANPKALLDHIWIYIDQARVRASRSN